MYSRKTIVKQNSFCSEHFHVPRGCRASGVNNGISACYTDVFSGQEAFTCVHTALILNVSISEKKVYMGDKLTDCMFVLCILKSLYSKLFGFSFFFFPKGSIKNVYKYDGIAFDVLAVTAQNCSH